MIVHLGPLPGPAHLDSLRVVSADLTLQVFLVGSHVGAEVHLGGYRKRGHVKMEDQKNFMGYYTHVGSINTPITVSVVHLQQNTIENGKAI